MKKTNVKKATRQICVLVFAVLASVAFTANGEAFAKTKVKDISVTKSVDKSSAKLSKDNKNQNAGGAKADGAVSDIKGESKDDKHPDTIHIELISKRK